MGPEIGPTSEAGGRGRWTGRMTVGSEAEGRREERESGGRHCCCCSWGVDQVFDD